MSERERYQLEIYLKEKVPIAEIAKKMNRCRATIYNEIKRGNITLLNSDLTTKMVYCADVAQNNFCNKQKNKGRPLKIGNDLSFVRFVETKIKERYSFYAILHLSDFKHYKTNVCERTLYNYYYNDIFLNLSPADLPYCKQRKKKKIKKRNVALHNIKVRSIEERPREILKRQEYGHWEMDTVVGGRNKKKHVLLVLTERMTREEIIKRIPDKKAESVIKALDKLERKLGKKRFRQKFKSITMDNGVEFSDWKNIEKKGRTITYYCHPFCSSERASNENQNRFIRRFVPKGSDIGNYTDKEIQAIEDFINNYPRELFGGLSSKEFLSQLKLE